jgi:FkbM family methyltransferase
MLWRTVHGAGAGLDWYGNSTYEWLRDSPDALRRKGITPRGLLAAGPLVARLRTHPYVVVPAGTLDDRDDRHDLGLSLPGRIIFAMATANTPVIVLGSPRTSAARFVERFQIGAVCDYDPAAFRRAVEHLCQPDVQLRLRENAARVARGFSDAGITGWVWSSLERGEPDDSRFEDLMPRSPGDMVSFIEPPVPPHIYHHYIPVYHVMRRLRGQGMRPDFIIDVGASHGIWSYAASRAFPETRFILIDPLLSRYDRRSHEAFLEVMPRVETLEVAVSNRAGRTAFQVSHDLWGSSLLDPADFRSYESIEVEVDTLDNIARARNITGRGLLKLDVQCAEHLVLEGARELLSRVDGMVVEVSLVRYDARALILTEMLDLLDGLGYRYYDETGVWRSPTDGTLLQKEIVFLRKDLLAPTMSRAIAR